MTVLWDVVIAAALLHGLVSAECRKPGAGVTSVQVRAGPCSTFPQTMSTSGAVSYDGTNMAGAACSDGNTWAAVKYNGGAGFIATQYLGPCSGTTTSSSCRRLTGSSVNLRTGPCTTYGAVVRLDAGQTVDHLGWEGTNVPACSDGVMWAKIVVGGGIGWVDSSKLTTCEETSALVWPIQGKSALASYNFGDRRNEGARCHVGCDIQQGTAVAIAPGEVTNVFKFYDCSGGSVHAVLIYHSSLGVTINYGEIDSGTVTVAAGATVSQGQKLGTASRCGMLHFEVYQGKRRSNSHWYPPSGVTIKSGQNCRNVCPSTKPAEILDCSVWLAAKFPRS